MTPLVIGKSRLNYVFFTHDCYSLSPNCCLARVQAQEKLYIFTYVVMTPIDMSKNIFETLITLLLIASHRRNKPHWWGELIHDNIVPECKLNCIRTSDSFISNTSLTEKAKNIWR